MSAVLTNWPCNMRTRALACRYQRCPFIPPVVPHSERNTVCHNQDAFQSIVYMIIDTAVGHCALDSPVLTANGHYTRATEGMLKSGHTGTLCEQVY